MLMHGSQDCMCWGAVEGQEHTTRGKMSRRDPSAPLTHKEHGVGPNDEVREVQPLDNVVIEAGALESPGVVCRTWSGRSRSGHAIEFPAPGDSGVGDSPRQGAGGMPMQMKYWKVMMQARKQQYLGQISAMAFLLRRYRTAISQQA